MKSINSSNFLRRPSQRFLGRFNESSRAKPIAGQCRKNPSLASTASLGESPSAQLNVGRGGWNDSDRDPIILLNACRPCKRKKLVRIAKEWPPMKRMAIICRTISARQMWWISSNRRYNDVQRLPSQLYLYDTLHSTVNLKKNCIKIFFFFSFFLFLIFWLAFLLFFSFLLFCMYFFFSKLHSLDHGPRFGGPYPAVGPRRPVLFSSWPGFPILDARPFQIFRSLATLQHLTFYCIDKYIWGREGGGERNGINESPP